jgi:phosphoribosyl-ATP pyrophosphohydrolase
MSDVLDTLFATILDRQSNPSTGSGQAPSTSSGQALRQRTVGPRSGQAPSTGSYTARLLSAGEDEVLKKVGEEAMEVILAAKGQGDARVISEVADLFYHLLVLLAARGLTLADVEAELVRRRR